MSVKDNIEDIFLIRNPGKTIEELNWRMDGRLEWMCKHGIGHTVFDLIRCGSTEGNWIHGCDGCCKNLTKIEIRFSFPKECSPKEEEKSE